MNEEQLNRKIEFVVEQQAQFSVDIQLMRAAQEAESKARQEQYSKLSDALIGLVGIVGQLTQSQKETAVRVDALTARVDALTEKLDDTNERLNIFIDVLERYISGQQDKNNS